MLPKLPAPQRGRPVPAITSDRLLRRRFRPKTDVGNDSIRDSSPLLENFCVERILKGADFALRSLGQESTYCMEARETFRASMLNRPAAHFSGTLAVKS
jgi:hypothetical protein